MSDEILLDVRDLRMSYGNPRRGEEEVDIVKGVSFTIAVGETLALVGESGSGKTTTAFCVARLLEPRGGSIEFMGVDIAHLRRDDLRRSRRHLQMIFQDPYSSLNPRLCLADIVAEPLKAYRVGSRKSRRLRALQLLDQVGLSSKMATRFPRELSGGQRQRVGIARALALNPKLMICDEPVASLDVSMQAQIVNLLRDLQQEFDLAYLFISHDLGVVRSMCDDVIVMNGGAIVERGPATQVYDSPTHEYTRRLIDAARTRTSISDGAAVADV